MKVVQLRFCLRDSDIQVGATTSSSPELDLCPPHGPAGR